MIILEIVLQIFYFFGFCTIFVLLRESYYLQKSFNLYFVMHSSFIFAVYLQCQECKFYILLKGAELS